MASVFLIKLQAWKTLFRDQKFSGFAKFYY